MNGSQKLPGISCREVQEQLLIDRSDLAAELVDLVETHLTVCADCRNYRKILAELQKESAIENDIKIVPDQAIRSAVLARMKTKRNPRKTTFSHAWELLKSVMEYRIPVYQALFTLVLIGILYFSVSQFSGILAGSQHGGGTKTAITNIEAQRLNVMDDLNAIDRQRIGQNVQEDTILFRFFRTVM